MDLATRKVEHREAAAGGMQGNMPSRRGFIQAGVLGLVALLGGGRNAIAGGIGGVDPKEIIINPTLFKLPDIGLLLGNNKLKFGSPRGVAECPSPGSINYTLPSFVGLYGNHPKEFGGDVPEGRVFADFSIPEGTKGVWHPVERIALQGFDTPSDITRHYHPSCLDGGVYVGADGSSTFVTRVNLAGPRSALTGVTVVRVSHDGKVSFQQEVVRSFATRVAKGDEVGNLGTVFIPTSVGYALCADSVGAQMIIRTTRATLDGSDTTNIRFKSGATFWDLANKELAAAPSGVTAGDARHKGLLDRGFRLSNFFMVVDSHPASMTGIGFSCPANIPMTALFEADGLLPKGLNLLAPKSEHRAPLIPFLFIPTKDDSSMVLSPSKGLVLPKDSIGALPRLTADFNVVPKGTRPVDERSAVKKGFHVGICSLAPPAMLGIHTAGKKAWVIGGGQAKDLAVADGGLSPTKGDNAFFTGLAECGAALCTSLQAVVVLPQAPTSTNIQKTDNPGVVVLKSGGNKSSASPYSASISN